MRMPSLVLPLAVVFWAPGVVSATGGLALQYSFDTAVGAGLAVAEKSHVVVDDPGGGLSLEALPGLPAEVDLDALHRLEDGSVLFSLDVAATLPGGLSSQAADVLRWNGSSYTVELAAEAAGVPEGANVDALTAMGMALLVSFDVTVQLGGVSVSPADLAHWDGRVWSLWLAAAAHGVPAGLDLDAAHLIDNGRVLLSFDGSGTVGTVAFEDEDVLELEPVTSTWRLAFRGADRAPEWSRADLDALFAAWEPGLGAAKDMSSSTTGLPATITITYTFENLSSNSSMYGISALEDLSSVFGSHGVDWTFGWISSSPAALSNPSFDGNAVTELVNQAPSQDLVAGATATVTVQLVLLTTAGGGGNEFFCNQIALNGHDWAATPYSDLSTDGFDPDPNGDGVPDEELPSCLLVEELWPVFSDGFESGDTSRWSSASGRP